MKGIELSQQFYEEYGRPMIASLFPEYEAVIAVGIAGEGSDCFGYDDSISRDHDFEAGFCLWIPDRLGRELEFQLFRAYGRLPGSYLGVERSKQSFGGQNRRGVILNGDFYSRFTGRAGLPESLMEWLKLPEYSLACAVNGKVFRDQLGEFSAVRRELLRGYPEDVRRKKIAARAALMAQSGQYNFTRCEKRGEMGAAGLALYEFIQNGLSMLFLLNNRYMPYYKWAFRAGKELPVLGGAAGKLELLAAAGHGGIHGGTGNSRGGLAGSVSVSKEIEEICGLVAAELRRQGLTDGNWDYLEPHAYEIMERIQDGTLRNLHVMEG